MTEETINIDDLTFKIYKHDESDLTMLNESKNKGKQLIGNYTYDIHKPHNPNGEYHIHLRDKGNEILSMNKISGSAHDGYHGVRIPNKAFKALKDKFPDWNWPSNQILETSEFTYILNKNLLHNLRPVNVFKHKNEELHHVESFLGFFHQFAIDLIRTGGQGTIQKTVALIENEEGYIIKVPVNSFKFMDTEL